MNLRLHPQTLASEAGEFPCLVQQRKFAAVGCNRESKLNRKSISVGNAPWYEEIVVEGKLEILQRFGNVWDTGRIHCVMDAFCRDSLISSLIFH